MKKKASVKAVSFIICTALFLSCSANFITSKADNVYGDLTESEIASLAQVDAIKAYFSIYDYLVYETDGEVTGHHAGYGGCYINDDNVLVIQIKSGFGSLISEIDARLEAGAPVVYQYCDWSINEAEDALDTFASTLSANTGKIQRVIYSSERNAFIVDVKPEDLNILSQAAQSTTRTRSTLRSPIILNPVAVYDETDVPELEMAAVPANVSASSTSIYGGSTLYYKKSNGTFSPNATVGVCGTYGNQACILTAGHVPFIGTHYLSTSTTSVLLTTSLLEYGDWSEGDYAALKIPSGYTRTNKVYTSDQGTTGSITSYYMGSMFPEGAIVHKYGITTGYTAGRIIGTGYTGYIPDVAGYSYVVDHTAHVVPLVDGSIPPFSAGGDSGAPVWCLSGSGQRILLGVLSGGNDYNMYYTPIDLAVDAGFTPYSMTPITDYE